jgi:hypothetical protein
MNIKTINVDNTSRLDLIKNYGIIIQTNPYAVFIEGGSIHIVHYYRDTYKKFNRVLWQATCDHYDHGEGEFFPVDKWNPSIGTILKRNVPTIDFCNSAGLNEVLGQLDLQADWLLYKLKKS